MASHMFATRSLRFPLTASQIASAEAALAKIDSRIELCRYSGPDLANAAERVWLEAPPALAHGVPDDLRRAEAAMDRAIGRSAVVGA